MEAYADFEVDGFEMAVGLFTEMLTELRGPELGEAGHAEVEEHVRVRGREMLRAAFQGHLDLRAQREERVPGPVVGPDGLGRTRAEKDLGRQLVSVFGPVTVSRIGYRGPGLANVFPADEKLNLPEGSVYSHGICRLAVIEGVRGSFGQALEAIERSTGVRVGTRQIRDLMVRSAQDADLFYATRPVPDCAGEDILVLTFDGKGVVMRTEALREATAKAAANASTRLGSRLSPGEKKGRKRMAELACVYDIAPEPRTSADVMPRTSKERKAVQESKSRPRARASAKWLSASLIKDIPAMVASGFSEADRRDPDHQRTWVVLVDGNRTQIDAIEAEAARRGVKVTIIIDLIHVLEYLWSAAWSFFPKAEPGAEEWVAAAFRKVLDGKANRVAEEILDYATRYGYTRSQRKNADTAAAYLSNHAAYLDYPTALAGGWPIATGIIEGACRYLIKDRMDITGARWGLDTAEAVLTLRATHSTGNLPDYWAYHLTQEHNRAYPQTQPKAA